MEISEFPPSVVERLGYYVYALRDPRTDAVFYIGKGTANRVFAHARSELQDFRDTDKLLQIREIRAAGLLVRYEILRHGLTEKEALEVEAALIDFVGLTDLTNEVVGHGTDRRGRMTVNDLVATYRAEAITPTEPLVLIIINRLYRPNMTPEQLYETTRGNWILGPRRQEAKYAFAVYRGLVREVFRIHRWEPTEEKRRWRFNGTVANDMRRYIGGDVSSYIKRGSQSPVLYLNC